MSAPSDSPAAERPLRVGFLLDSLVVPAWQARCIRDVQQSGVAEVALVVLRDGKPAPRRSLPERLRSVAPQLLYALYTRLDARLYTAKGDPSEPVDVAPLLAGVPTIRLAPRETKFCDYFEDPDADAIDAHELDVAVRFGFRILKGRALRIARHGVWSYHHGDNLVNRGSPPGLWEVLEESPVTGSVLQVLTEDLDAGRVIYRSWSATDTRSVRRNKRKFYWKSSAFLGRKLRDLAAGGPAALCDPLGERAAGWTSYSQRLYTTPTNGEMARGLVRLAGRVVGEKVRAALRTDEHWRIFWQLDKKRPSSDVPASTLYRFKELVPPKDRFWADPFVAVHQGKHYLFVEELFYGNRDAHISVAELGADGEWTMPVPVLQRPYHLSYPFVFEWEGQWYMIPETGANRAVELYRAEEFPHRWTLDRVLLDDVHAVDATLARLGDRWWMFVNVAEPGASTWDELHLYHADSPLGPWTPHRRNPVKSDVRGSRPAGRLFQSGGEWYRPAQDCSIRYGYATVIHRVVRLDEEQYSEVEVARILPQWKPGLRATHTLNASGGLTVADGWVRASRFW